MGFQNVLCKLRKGQEAAPASDYYADIKQGVSIVVKKGLNGAPNKFVIGDMAEYDSWNLSYFGPIVAITNKTVSIKEKHGNKIRRLDLERFCSRNHNFDLGQKIKSNNETSYYI